jgi:asparagine synthase (glutamine-hydrolysing)
VHRDVGAAVDEMDSVLRGAVHRQMEADVPLGAFLSGGIDSSLIASLMQAQSSRKVRTFSVGFDDVRYDESQHAVAVAAHLGTEHTTLHATSKMALDLVPRLPELYDEPFADSSQLPTALLAQLTRQHVTVALSGDGGDELFGGYNRHLWVPRLWRRIGRMPGPARQALAGLLRAMRPADYDRVMSAAGRVLPGRWMVRTLGEKLHKLASALECSSEQELFRSVSSMNPGASRLLASDARSASVFRCEGALEGFDGLDWMLLHDTLNYMVNDVLVKVDRACMASSLEVRVPFLDPEVFRAAWRLPSDFKIRDGQGKWILRQLLDRYVPRELIERPKMGFAVPLDDWLRGPLREWAEDLLAPVSLAAMPQLDAVAVRRLWSEQLKGRGHHAQQLWAVLQLLSWQRYNGVGAA